MNTSNPHTPPERAFAYTEALAYFVAAKPLGYEFVASGVKARVFPIYSARWQDLVSL
jgi:hypothetical protein